MSGDVIYPLPEMLCPGAWEIREVDRGGHVSPQDRVLGVPLLPTRFARAVRGHEMAHVRFSPAQFDHERLGVQRSTLLAVEDARVNELARRAGLEVIDDLDDPSLPVPDPAVDPRAATLFLVAGHGTRSFDRTLTALAKAGEPGRRVCDLGLRSVEAIASSESDPTFEVTVAVARRLDRDLGPEPPGWAQPGIVCCRGSGKHARTGERPRISSRRGRWGVLRRIEEPPRPTASRRRGVPAASRATDEGAILRAPHRLVLDGRVFARRARRHGGSVLIDASGSMAWTGPQLLALLDAAPAALVACYEGAQEGWGVIRVLARGGWRVAGDAIRPPLGRGGNVIDGPALRWLARQPPPRLWVSDGGVSGVGDCSADGLRREVEEICARAHIVRVRDASAARAALARRVAAAGGRRTQVKA